MGLADSPDAARYRHVSGLYASHHGWLQGWLRQRMGCRSDAADLTQDTFVRLLAQPQAPQPSELRQPRAYLATVARRLMLNLYRRRSLEQAWLHTLAQMPEQHAPSAEEQCLIAEALQTVDRLLHGLTQPVRTAFLLSQLEGRSHGEIAAALAINVRTVQRYLTKAMEHCMVYALQEGL